MNSKLLWLPVSDVDRANRFYEMLGWRLDADFTTGDDFSGGAVYTSRLGVLDHFLKAQQVSSRRRAMSQRPNRSRRGSYSYISALAITAALFAIAALTTSRARHRTRD